MLSWAWFRNEHLSFCVFLSTHTFWISTRARIVNSDEATPNRPSISFGLFWKTRSHWWSMRIHGDPWWYPFFFRCFNSKCWPKSCRIWYEEFHLKGSTIPGGQICEPSKVPHMMSVELLELTSCPRHILSRHLEQGEAKFHGIKGGLICLQHICVRGWSSTQ